MTAVAYGCEIAFRLGPCHDDEARAVAARLRTALPEALGQVLFLNEAGEYGLLIEWADRDAATRCADHPALAAERARLGERLGRLPGVRVYRMERHRSAGAHL